MSEKLLISITFLLDVRAEHFTNVHNNIGRAYAYTLSLLGAEEVHVTVLKFPPSQKNSKPEEEGG